MMCTHFQHRTEWRPTVQDSMGCLGQPISGWVIELICICSTSVTNIGEKLLKLKWWTRIYIGINERRCASRQNHFQCDPYWVMSFKALDTAEPLLKIRLLTRLLGTRGWFYVGAIDLSLMRVNFKTIFWKHWRYIGNEHTVTPWQ